jgi:RNA polymerase sigma factor for flagellar operon FliA
MVADRLGCKEPRGTGDGMRDLEALLPLAASVARRTLHRPTPVFDYEDAVATGLMGLVEARNRHDPSRGNNFPAYACQRVRGAVLDSIRALDYLPQGARKRRALAAARENGERLDDPRSRWDESLPLPPICMSTLKGQGGEDDALLPDIPDEDPFLCPEWFTDRSEMVRELEGAFRVLPPRERVVVTLRYWERQTLAEIGHRLGVSAGRVRQLEKRALTRLRQHLESGNGSNAC